MQRPLRQIAFVLGLALIVIGVSTLALVLRNLVFALRHDGATEGWHSPGVTVDGAIAFVTLVIGMALLRVQLRRRLPRLLVAVVIAVAVLLGIDAGYVK
jgi:ABC-type nickel/cobalt efflux system permease component RcnA